MLCAMDQRPPDDDAPAPDRQGTAQALLELRYSQLGIDLRQVTSTNKGTIVDPTFEHLHDAPTIDGATDGAIDGAVGGIPETLGAEPAVPLADDKLGAKARARGEQPSPIDPLAIIVGPVVGTGGMGIVNVAEQPSLRREVAVKRVRPERTNASSINALLREAWVTGTLEHPNIVPIHLLLEVDGSPRVVMKRIEGVTWDALLESPDLIAEFGGRARKSDPEAPRNTSTERQAKSQDQLLFHLRILSEVCQAVHFAHARGVLHLDLKPENVMVGRFGEVYVVDWGIAASLPEGPTWLPQARLIRSVRGTPSWMPPELATAEGERVGVRSDVYLLGSLLHAVLTGNEQRHQGVEMIDLLAAAFESLPYRYGPKVPAELAALANRATAREPADRPESAEEFRGAIEDYLEHRHSTELEARATAGKDALLAFFARSQQGITEGTKVGQSLRRDFLECRFAFRQALEIWPANERAKAGLQEVLRAMANFALAHDQLERAAESVAELSPPDPVLDQRIRAMRLEHSLRHERLLELERDASIDAFREKRVLMAFFTGLLFLAWNIVCGYLHRSGTLVFELTDLLWKNGLTVVAFIIACWIVRNSLLTTATNRRLVVLFGTGFVAVLTFWFAIWIHGKQHPERPLGVLEVVALSDWAYTFFALAVAFTMDIRAAWLAIPVTIIAVFAPMFEQYAFELLGVEGFLCGAWLAFIWRHPAPREGIRSFAASADAAARPR